MSFNQNLQAHYDNVETSNIMNTFIKYYIDSELVALKNLITDSAPETLDTLNELAAALGDDPSFFSNMSTANTALQTAIDAVQADVDQNEVDSDAAIAAESTARGVAVAGEASTRQAAIDAVNALISTLQTEAAARLVRIETLEADPTTATAVAAVQSDVDQNEADADAAIALKLDTASPAATGTLTVDTNASLKFDSNLTKVENVLRGTGINIGNNIELVPAASGGRVEITGDLILDASDLTDAADDTAAAAAGLIVGQVYHNSGVLRVRLS